MCKRETSVCSEAVDLPNCCRLCGVQELLSASICFCTAETKRRLCVLVVSGFVFTARGTSWSESWRRTFASPPCCTRSSRGSCFSLSSLKIINTSLKFTITQRMMEESAEVRLKFQFPQFFFQNKGSRQNQALNMLNQMGRNNRKYIKVR